MTLRVYALAAAGLAFMALAGVALWYRGEAISATAEAERARAALAVAVEANEAQADAIRRLTELSDRTETILADIAGKLAAINQNTADTTEAIADLERTNEDVRAYLAGRVPDDLRRVLNRR